MWQKHKIYDFKQTACSCDLHIISVKFRHVTAYLWYKLSDTNRRPACDVHKSYVTTNSQEAYESYVTTSSQQAYETST